MTQLSIQERYHRADMLYRVQLMHHCVWDIHVKLILKATI